ncbi:MAG: hypothetical protein QOJ11_823 [Frankiales bacterium]|jgi:hypothetical protein|nr:hypothetical protein [Frankiales bacterium]
MVQLVDARAAAVGHDETTVGDGDDNGAPIQRSLALGVPLFREDTFSVDPIDALGGRGVTAEMCTV